jgi:HK97 family phage prohead protease
MKRTREVIRGYLVPWGDLARLPDGSMEQPRRGAFAESVARVSAESPLPFDWEHDSIGLNGPRRVPVGIITEAREDRTGVLITVRMNSPAGAEVLEAVRSGAVRGLSAMWPESTAKYDPPTKQGRRVLTSAQLTGGCATGTPAYKATRAWVETEEYDDGQPEPAALNNTAAPVAAEGSPQ